MARPGVQQMHELLDEAAGIAFHLRVVGELPEELLPLGAMVEAIAELVGSACARLD